MLTERRRKFQTLLMQTHDQPSDWLIRIARNGAVPVVSRLAALRELVWRERGTGLPYPQRRAMVRTKFGI